MSHYLADKKKNESAVLEMAGKVTEQLAGKSAGFPGSRSTDEGIKAVVAAYEAKQSELHKENQDLRAALTSAQADLKSVMNRQSAKAKEDAAKPIIEDSFIKRLQTMDEKQLRTEIGNRLKEIHRKLANIPIPEDEACRTAMEQGLATNLKMTLSISHEQDVLISGLTGALRNAQALADTRRVEEIHSLTIRHAASLKAAIDDVRSKELANAQKKIEEASIAAQAEVCDIKEQLSLSENMADEYKGKLSSIQLKLSNAERMNLELKSALVALREQFSEEVESLREAARVEAEHLSASAATHLADLQESYAAERRLAMDEFQKQLTDLEASKDAELASLRESHAEDQASLHERLQEADAALMALREQFSEEVEGLREAARVEAERLSASAATHLADLQESYAAERRLAMDEFQKQLTDLSASKDAELASLRESHAEEQASLHKRLQEADAALMALREQFSEEVEGLREAARVEAERLSASAATHLADLQESYAAERRLAMDEFQKQLTDLSASKDAELASLKTTHGAEMATLAHNTVLELDAKHLEKLKQISDEAQANVDALQRMYAMKVSELENKVVSLEDELAVEMKTRTLQGVEIEAARSAGYEATALASAKIISLENEVKLLKAVAESGTAKLAETAEKERSQLFEQVRATKSELSRLKSNFNVAEAEKLALKKQLKDVENSASLAEAHLRELAITQLELEDNKRTFESEKQNYRDLMGKYAPGLGAGVLLERAVARKAHGDAGPIYKDGVIPAGR